MALKGLFLSLALAFFLVLFFFTKSGGLKAIRKFAPLKYSMNSPTIQTSTPDYGEPPKNHTSYIGDDFVQFEGDFMIDDTDVLKKIADSLACMPMNFGYSVERGEQVFPPYEYPSCASTLESAPPLILLDKKTYELTVSCEDSQKVRYLTDSDIPPGHLWRYNEIEDLWDVKDYKGAVTLKNTTEFVYAVCEDSEKFTAATYLPHFNQEAYARAKAITATIGQRHKPLTILMLTVDSYSRRHFFRKLPKTVEFLNTVKSGDDYSIFDFKIHNIFGPASIDNIIPIFANFTHSDVDNKMQDIIGEAAMWNILKRQGYISYLGFEDCDYYFPEEIGHLPKVDHITSSFYCAAYRYLKLRMKKRLGRQHRCIGEHMSHFYILNYTQNFIDLYPDLNQWAYIHVNTAHEETGEHAVTLDDDLTSFLTKLLLDDSREYFVVLQADHGMRYGNWFTEIEGYQENKLPALFFIASNSLLDRIPGSRETISRNTQRLTSKIDLRATVLALANQPHGLSYPVHSESYLSNHYDLVTEAVPRNRTCQDIGILPWFCSCISLIELSPNQYSKGTELHSLVNSVVDSALTQINKETFTPLHLERGIYCEHLSLAKIEKVYAAKYTNVLEQIQVQFRVNESKAALFEVFSVVGSDSNDYLIKPKADREPIRSTVYRGYEAFIRVIGIMRKDPYAGPCEQLSEAHGLKGQYCICKDQSKDDANAKAI